MLELQETLQKRRFFQHSLLFIMKIVCLRSHFSLGHDALTFWTLNLRFHVCNLQNFIIFGYARTKMTTEELRNMISKTLTCRIDKRYFSECSYNSIKSLFHSPSPYFHFVYVDKRLRLTGRIVKIKWNSS